MKKDYFVSIKELLSESSVRDIVLFTFLFVLVMVQEWDNILLFMFPLITFSFSMFFKLVSTNKWRTEFENSPMAFNPLGLEKLHAARLNFTALFQLALLMWLGAESLYHPQLIQQYFFYFNIIFVFAYTFGFYWIFIDLWKYSRIEVLFGGIDFKVPNFDEINLAKSLDNLISFLKLKLFKKISLICFLLFAVLNLTNIAISTLPVEQFVPSFEYDLPGTGIEGSEPISLSVFAIIALGTPPIASIVFLIATYKSITNINKMRLSKILEPLPKHIQIKIVENLKLLNRRTKELLRTE